MSIFEQLSKKDCLVIDYREPEEVAFTPDFIGAKRIPVSDIGNRLDEIGEKKDRPILVYYGTGSRSDHAESILRSHGYTDIVSTKNPRVIQPLIQRGRRALST